MGVRGPKTASLTVGEGLIPETAILRLYKGDKVTGSSRKDLSDREELASWQKENLGGVEEGAETEEAEP